MKLGVILYVVAFAALTIAVILSTLLGKTAWLRLPDETPERKARREALQARGDLLAKGIAFGMAGTSFLALPLGLAVAAVCKLRPTTRDKSNSPSEPVRGEPKSSDAEKNS